MTLPAVAAAAMAKASTPEDANPAMTALLPPISPPMIKSSATIVAIVVTGSTRRAFIRLSSRPTAMPAAITNIISIIKQQIKSDQR